MFGTILSSLKDQYLKIKTKDMRQVFVDDPNRFNLFSLTYDDWLIDWSKCHVNWETMSLLEKLADAADLSGRRDSMFSGKSINTTENRQVLHTALRNTAREGLYPDDPEISRRIASNRQAVEIFSEDLRSGKVRGSRETRITDVVNIGIGGSDLGTAMAIQALSPYHDGPRVHHISNVDGAHLHDTLAKLKPKSTLIIISSKTFSTTETMINAKSAQRWVCRSLGDQALGQHFVAISANVDRAEAFGIHRSRIFHFEEGVGGRYSIWSAVGLPLMIAIGKENFNLFLRGGREMDIHFLSRPYLQNAPIIMGLIGYWHRVICDYPTRAIIPYDQRLARFPAWLQQLDMESNGKSVSLNGQSLATSGSPLVWGEPGTSGQHAFFQFLHQGLDIIPIEFIVAANGHEPELQLHHDVLLANCLAQAEALMNGHREEEVESILHQQGLSQKKIKELTPHHVCKGNRPSLLIIYQKLDPKTLGRLLALYEHRVFVEGILYGVNSFDQFGVELGKGIAGGLLPRVQVDKEISPEIPCNSSLSGLLKHIHRLKRKCDY